MPKVNFNPLSQKFDFTENTAINVNITDSGAYYTGTEVETALQEIGDGTTLDGRYLKLDASNDPITENLELTKGLIVNEGGGDNDTRIEGNTDTNLLLIDAGNDRIGIGVAAPAAKLDILTTSTSVLKLTNTQASGASAGAGILGYSHDGAAMGSGHRLGFFLFGGMYDASSVRNSAGFEAFASELWDATQSGSYFRIVTTTTGTNTRVEGLRIDHSQNVLIGSTDGTDPDIRLNANGSAVFNEQGGDNNVRIEGQNDVNLLVTDADVDRVGIGMNNPSVKLHTTGGGRFDSATTTEAGLTVQTTDDNTTNKLVELLNSGGNDIHTFGADGAVIFNEQGAAVDIRFEGDTDVSLLFLDGSEDLIGIGTNTPLSKLDIRRESTQVARFYNTAASASNAGAGMQAYSYDGAAMGSGHRLGFLLFGGSYDATNVRNSAGISSFATEAWSGSQSGSNLIFQTTKTGTNTRTESIRIDHNQNVLIGSTDGTDGDIYLNADGSVVINEQGADVDYRIEGVGVANAFFVQGSDGFVGINTNAPAAHLEINAATTTNKALILQTTDDNATNDLVEIHKADDTVLGAITPDARIGLGRTPGAGSHFEIYRLTLNSSTTATGFDCQMNETSDNAIRGANFSVTSTGSGPVGGIYGLFGLAGVTAANPNVTTMAGLQFGAVYAGTGTVTTMIGADGYVQPGSAAGTITAGMAMRAEYKCTWGTTTVGSGLKAMWTGLLGTTTDFRGIDLSGWTNLAGTLTTSYGIYADTTVDLGTTSWFIYSLSTSDSRITGDLQINSDSKALVLGAGQDAKAYYDGTDLILDPDVVGSGVVNIGVTGDDDMKLNTIEIDGDINHDGSNIGFFGTAPSAQAAAYTPSNVVADRSYDADSTTLDEIADVLGTLIADLQSYGLLQ